MGTFRADQLDLSEYIQLVWRQSWIGLQFVDLGCMGHMELMRT